MTRRHSYFGLEEANALVPTLEYFFRQLLLLRRVLERYQQELLAGGATLKADQVRLPRRASDALKATCDAYFNACQGHDALLDEIIGLGVDIVDAEAGIVHLYTWWEGEEVVLSWQFGESTIQFWCDPGEPFGSRRPIRQIFFDAPVARAERH